MAGRPCQRGGPCTAPFLTVLMLLLSQVGEASEARFCTVAVKWVGWLDRDLRCGAGNGFVGAGELAMAGRLCQRGNGDGFGGAGKTPPSLIPAGQQDCCRRG